MNLRSFLAISLLILSPALAETARATSVEIVWTSTTGSGVPGGSSIDAVAGDRIIAEVRILPDTEGVRAYAVSVVFDSDMLNELDLVSATEFLPAQMEDNFSPGAVAATIESSNTAAGFVIEIEAVTLGNLGPTTGTMVAAELTFDVTANVTTDGNDVVPGAFNTGDGTGNNSLNLITPVFVGAAVNLGAPSVPILSTPALISMSLLMAVAGIWAIVRRRAGMLHLRRFRIRSVTRSTL